MGTVLPVRPWRFRPPRKFRTPQILRALARRLARLRRHSGFLALTGAIATAAFLSGPWFTERPTRTATGATAAVIDGDSLRAGHLDIRLIGIDAPELRQACRDGDGREWPCGRAAREQLRALASRGDIACAAHGDDRTSRTLAVCSAGDIADLGEAMVRAGYAVDASGFTSRYAAAEAQARAQRRGIWRGPFEHPQDWRAGNRRRETVGLSGR